jgi:arabinofuranan 3-O-arabinosyltransferase
MSLMLSRDRLVRAADRAATAPAPAGSRPLAPVVLALRLAACCAALLFLAFSQDPGKISRDTKLDLVVDPAGFMARALSLWDDSSAFGQLQNQAYGYLFPMGPFFALAHELGLSPWVTQRLWMGTLMSLAFLGVYVLAGRMGIGSPLTRTVAAFAFALTPRLATVLGPISSEALPMCLAPWVLVPLVRGAREGSERRAAAASALALACCGAVNAVATLAVLPLPVLYLITRRSGARKRRLAAWWSLAVALVSLWWVVPLVMLGAYSFPFLDYIETSIITTSGTSLAEVLRGGSHWLAGLVAEGAPWWRGGWMVETAPAVVLASLVVAGLGLAGVARRTTPERLFLAAAVASGLLLVTFGYSGPLGPVGASGEAELLDGVLAPFRNVHKFDVVLRVPLVLGLAALLTGVRRPNLRPVTHLAAICAVIVTAAPFLLGAIIPAGSYRSLPTYWQDTTTWLAEHDVDGTALLLPASGFGEYYWGRPMDDPMQPLAGSPWVVRNQIPLGAEGSTRLLDAVQQVLNDGRGSDGLAPALARAGVTHVVLRNDLDWARVGAPRPVLVHQAIERSGGFQRVATFGPGTAANRVGAQQVSDYGMDPLFPAVEVLAVTGGQGRVSTYAADDVVGLVGGPDGLVQAEAAGVTTGRAVVLDGDPLATDLAPAAVVLSDAARARAVNFGAVYDNATQTLGTVRPPGTRKRSDFLPWPGMPRSVARFRGASVAASSSAADTDAVVLRGPEYSVAAALDGNPDSAWVSGARGAARGQWVELALDEPVDSPIVRLAVLDTSLLGARTTAVQVVTDAGSRRTRLRPGQSMQAVRVPPGHTSTVRVRIAGVDRERAGPVAVGIRELAVSGVDPRLVTALPEPSSPAPTDAVLLARPRGERTGCVRATGGSGCAPGVARIGEESGPFLRTFTTRSPLSAEATGWGVPVPGPALAQVVHRIVGKPALAAAASSSLVSEPAAQPGAVLDGDITTTWVASHGDRNPTLTLGWPRRRVVDSLQLVSPASPAASTPRQVEVSTRAGAQRVQVDADGWVRFAPVDVRQLMLRFPSPDPVFSADPRNRSLVLLPVGVAEVRVPALTDLYLPQDRTRAVALPCGRGPDLVVDGQLVPTAVSGTLGDLLDRNPMRITGCASAVLPAGQHELSSPATWLEVDRVSLVSDRSEPAAGGTTVRDLTVSTWSASQRQLTMTAGKRTVVGLGENFNAGWRGIFDGEPVATVRLDGWRQGFVVPAGKAGGLELVYGPDRAYRAGLVVGLLALLAVPILLLVPGRGGAPPAPAARLSRAPVAVLAVLTLTALAGPAGALCGLGALAVQRWWRGPAARWAAAAAVVLLALVGALGAFALDQGVPRWGTGSALSQVLVAVALAVVGVSLVDVEPADPA